MRKIILSILLLHVAMFALAQKGTATGKQAKDIITQLPDSSTVLNVTGHQVCTCIDSVKQAKATKTEKVNGVADCIDRSVLSYQLTQKILKLNNTAPNSREIRLQTDKQSREYKLGYYSIERWLKDSCKSMYWILFSSDDKTSAHSLTDNSEALEAYNLGVKPFKEENFTEAVKWFKKAVELDPKFVFAWDNLAWSYKKTNQLTEAEAACLQSLKYDPRGKVALQNIPIIYNDQKRYKDAADAYLKLLDVYPGDPEAYYGLGLVQLNMANNLEHALTNMCKAYNAYIEQKSPYRTDAETAINVIYREFKKAGKEDVFNRILKENHITR